MPYTPYIVYGVCTDEDSAVVASTNVIAHNTTTGERTNAVVTNSSGQYTLDLANLTSGYSTGDSITVYIRHNGYRGESTFSLTGDAGRETDISTSNQVTFQYLRNRLWKAVYDTLQTGTFAVSEDSIFSAMNDDLINSENYPLIIIYPPEIDRDGYTLDNQTVACDVSFLVEIYHTSARSAKTLTDEIEYAVWRAQEVWDGLGLRNLTTPSVDNDWYTTGNKKIHVTSFNLNFIYEGSVTVP